MPALSNILTRFLNPQAKLTSTLVEQQDIYQNTLSRLYGPFGIDYSKLRAKGTLQ